ncbi:MAG: hypothetical protein PF481_07615 [Bacteroidales bacterium]|jgi:hypothetical protein|nr:hypothetical protein [Bacteroidales bacterium]
MDNIWSSNIDNGYYEPYYEVLNWAADEALNYRPNSQKVFIIIGDEGVSGANAQDCYSNASTLSDASVAAKLVDEGVQTFLIVDNSYESYFSLIASQTGGSTEDIDDDSYTDLLEHIAEKIEGKYILSYCLDTSATSYVDTSFRRVKIAMASDTAINDTMSYEVKETPYIIRTAATQALDPVAQTRLQEVTVSAKLYTQDSVESLSVCYMNYHDTVFNCVNGTIMSEDSTGIVFGTTIPAAVVDSPTVFYYFSATLYDQTTIRSSPPASTNEYEGWTFAVLPNYPPLIDSVTYDPGTDSVLPCAPITVCARITDTTAYVDKKILYYQVQATPSAYIPITMDSCTTCGASDWYCATIPAEAATETGMSYYIYAEDNYESQGWHGTPEAPLEISYTYTKTATTDSMRLYIMNYAYATMNCDALLSTDTIWAYFINTCGDLQKGGYGVWEGFGYINIILYGDSDASDGYKDGFEDDDDVYFTLERNGFNYQLELDHSITYYDGDFDMVSATAAANIPIMEISGNAEIIYPGTTTTSTIDDTNFGTCDTATTHTFTIENIGCADMYVYSISVSDTLNFSVNAITQQVIAEGLDYDFDVTYNATEDATALVRVYNNTSTTPYTFTVGGLLADTLPSCDDITLSPNPLASWGGNVSIPLTTQCTLTVSIYDTMGNLISSVFGPTTMAAGTHSIYVNASGLSSNTVYVLVVERGDETCGLQFTVQ